MFPHVAVFSVSDIFFRSGTCTYKIWNTYSSAQFPNSCYSTRGPTKSQREREGFENNTTFPFSNMHVFNKCWSGRFNIYQERRLTNIFHIQLGHNLCFPVPYDCTMCSDRYFVVFYNHFSNSLHSCNILLWRNRWLQHKFGIYN